MVKPFPPPGLRQRGILQPQATTPSPLGEGRDEVRLLRSYFARSDDFLKIRHRKVLQRSEKNEAISFARMVTTPSPSGEGRDEVL